MNYRTLVIILLAFSVAACNRTHKGHSHENEAEHSHESIEGHSHDEVEEEHNHDSDEDLHEGHSHDAVEADLHGHEAANEIQQPGEHHHDDFKIKLTAYSKAFEVFAEADPFVVGKSTSILAHFTHLPSFKALSEGSVTARLLVGEKVARHRLEAPTRKGIYQFSLKPAMAGKGKLLFEIEQGNDIFLIELDVKVYASKDEAFHDSDAHTESDVNTTSFTKEQSWKIDFATEMPQLEKFGQLIKTSGVVQSSQSDEQIISAKTNGFVSFSASGLLVGMKVKSGQQLASVLSGELAENNMNVRYSEAKNNFEKAEQELKRTKELSADKLVSEKELLNAETNFKNSKLLFDNLQNGFNSKGQAIKSSTTGFVKEVLVKNGQYVEAGQALVSVIQNKNLLIEAEVQQKHAPLLGEVQTATFRIPQSNQAFNLEELSGKILSYGRSTSSKSHLIPVTFQIENNQQFMPGGIVEVFLKTKSNSEVITVPNSALLEQQGNFFVFVQQNPELFEKREVKLGNSDGIRTSILAGLSETERVVSKGAVMIKLAQSTGALDAHSGHVH